MFKFVSSPGFLQRFRAGEPDALEMVYAAYVGEVEGIVRGGARVPSITGADMEDLVHDIFLRAFEPDARQSFDAAREFGPYLGTIARNLMVDFVRRRAREPVVPAADSALQIPYPEHDSEPAWADPATMEVVNRYIAELPTDLLQVHEHRYVACRSQEETCRELAISRQHLRTLEKRLRAGLERELKQAELRQSAAVQNGRVTATR